MPKSKTRKYAPDGETVHFSITMPKALCRKIDAKAKKKKVSRSFMAVQMLESAK